MPTTRTFFINFVHESHRKILQNGATRIIWWHQSKGFVTDLAENRKYRDGQYGKLYYILLKSYYRNNVNEN